MVDNRQIIVPFKLLNADLACLILLRLSGLRKLGWIAESNEQQQADARETLAPV